MPNIDAINAANGFTPGQQKATNAVEEQYQNFLLLLTTQLQNQDPTAPFETNELTQQIASLSQVEQQLKTNDLLSQLVAAQGVGVTNGVEYIGKQVDVPGNSVGLSGGLALMAYSLENKAATTTVTIRNSLGQVVFTSDGTGKAGRNELIWDGTDNNGNPLPSGTYKFSVEAKDASGNDIPVTTYTTGHVSSITMLDGIAYASVAGVDVPISDIISVRELPTFVPNEPPPAAEDEGDEVDETAETAETNTETETETDDTSESEQA